MKRLLIFVLLIVIIPVYADQSVVSEYSLPNGLKIFVKEDHRAPAAIAQIWYKVGSSYESTGISGISHALEHMMFRGTKKYGHGVLDKIIVENGGFHNAFTGYDYTCYHEVLPVDKLPIIFDLESDRMQGLLFEEEGFAKEKQVVLEERKMSIEDSPYGQTYERFFATAFVSNPYHTMVLGWMHDIQNFTTADLKSWYKNWYVPNNAILVVVGDVQAAQIFKMAQKYFGSLQSADIPKIKPQKEVAPIGKRTVIVKVSAKLPYLIMGYNVPTLKTAEQPWKVYALEVISSILSGGDSTRLPKDLIRKHQIAVDAYANYNLYDRLDSLFILGGTPATGHTAKELELALSQQIKKLQTTLVSQEELERIKTQAIAGKIYKKDSLTAQASEIGALEAVGLAWKVADQYVQNIKAITPEQIKSVAKEYFIDDRLTVAELQPLKENYKQK